MGVERIDYVYLETHDWAKAVAFWQALGFGLVLNLGRAGRLEPAGGGPGVFVEEVAKDQVPVTQLYLHTTSDAFVPAAPVEITHSWYDSHWDTRLMELRDPDGRTVVLQVHPQKSR